MPDAAGVIRTTKNLPVYCTSMTADTTIAAAGETIAVTGIYISLGAAGSFAFKNAAGTVTFFTITLAVAGQVMIPLPHPFYLSAGEGGLLVDVPAAGSPQCAVWYVKESV